MKKKSMLAFVKELLLEYKKKRIWEKIVSVLVCVTMLFTTYALMLPAVTMSVTELTLPPISIDAEWVGGALVVNSLTVSPVTAQKTYYIQYSDDGGAAWTLSPSSQTLGNNVTTLTLPVSSGAALGVTLTPDIERKFRVVSGKVDKGAFVMSYKTRSYQLEDVYDAAKPGFSRWLADEYVNDFHHTKPTTAEEMAAAFLAFQPIPTVALNVSEPASAADHVTAAVTADPAGSYQYIWQYQTTDSETGETVWTTIAGQTGAAVDFSALTGFPFGGAPVRCLVRDAEGQPMTKTEEKWVNPQIWRFENEALPSINTELKLSSVVGCDNNRFDIRLGGTIFNGYLYYEGVAHNPDVPFSDADSYRRYLCRTYLEAYDQALGNGMTESVAKSLAVSKTREIWDRYLYDLFDPGAAGMGNTGTGSYAYPSTGGYGDRTLAWPKSSDSSFHADIDPKIDQLDYGFLENGIDYSNFISNMEKYATADAAGDENEDRKYNIHIIADGQAKAAAPVCIIFLIQTSWQMFDLLHANAVSGDGHTEVGTSAVVDELATFYDIKCAMLDFVDYMDTVYPGNNLVIGVTEVQHDGSSTMFSGKDIDGSDLHVTNNIDQLREGIIGWDIFGNCEHVHYDNDALSAALANLESNLSAWKDCYGHLIPYSDIQKVAVILGGTTENSNGDNGLKCVLPWGDFNDAKLNSVYGIRVADGRPTANNVMTPPIMSWLDYYENNGIRYKDANGGTGFTEKYVASNREKLLQTFIEIAEKERRDGGIELTAVDKYVEDAQIRDTVRPEFRIDTEKPVVASILNKDGSKMYETEIGLADETVIMTGYDAQGHGQNVTLSNVYFTYPTPDTTKGETKHTHVTFTGPFTYTDLEQVVQNLDIPYTLDVIEYADKTTDVDLTLGKFYNTKKAVLDFGIIAREDYLGSNNVFTNVGRPVTEYIHSYSDAPADSYTVRCFDDPQVNVPLEFTTVDGGHVMVAQHSTKDLYEIDADPIPDVIEDLMDNYGQTNGTLTYEWILPDGTVAGKGTATVEKGKTTGIRPDLTEGYLFNDVGNYNAQLVLTFEPDPVDPKGTFHDAVTRAAVKKKTHDGAVSITVVDASSTVDLTVRKEWKGGTPPVSSIHFKLKNQNGAYYTGAAGGLFSSSADDAYTYTLSGTGTTWETGITGLPALYDGEIQSYEAAEVSVDGYSSSVKTKTDTTYTYTGKMKISFTPTYSSSGSQRLRVTYSYNGTTYTKEIDAASYTSGTEKEITIDDLATDPAAGDPYVGAVSKIEYLNGDNDTYIAFVPDTFDPYGARTEPVGFPTFSFIAPAAKDNKNVVVTYQVNGGASQTVTKQMTMALGERVSLSDTGNPISEDDTITVTSVKIDNTTYAAANLTGLTIEVGMIRPTVKFKAPKALAKDAIIAVELVDTSDPTKVYSYSQKLAANTAKGGDVTLEYPYYIPEGEYEVRNIQYAGADLREETTISFVTKQKLTRNNYVTFEFGDGEGHTQLIPMKLAGDVNAGNTVTYTSGSVHPNAGYTLQNIHYGSAGTASDPLILADTTITFETPVKLENNKSITFTLMDELGQTYTLTTNPPAANAGAEVTVSFPYSSSNGLVPGGSYTVTAVTYNNALIEDETTVTFTTPIQLKKDDNGTVTAAITDGVHTYQVGGQLKETAEAGTAVTLTSTADIPEGDYTVTSLLYTNNKGLSQQVIEPSKVLFDTPIELASGAKILVELDGSTNWLGVVTTKDKKVLAGDTAVVVLNDAVPSGSHTVTGIWTAKGDGSRDKGISTNEDYDDSGTELIIGGGFPDCNIYIGGHCPDCEVEPGGTMPAAKVAYGGGLPDSSIAYERKSSLVASMLAPCSIPSGTNIKVEYTLKGQPGSFTTTTGQTFDARANAQFRSGVMTDGDYRITSVSRKIGNNYIPYYLPLDAEVEMTSELASASSVTTCAVVNTPEVHLPSTGSDGTRLFAGVGAAMMMFSIAAGYVLNNRRFG